MTKPKFTGRPSIPKEKKRVAICIMLDPKVLGWLNDRVTKEYRRGRMIEDFILKEMKK